MNAHTSAHAAASSAQPSSASPLAALSGVGTAVYRIGVLALLAAIAWPQISDRLSSLPVASALEQTGGTGGFRFGPSRRNNNNQQPAQAVTPANPPSSLLTKLDMPTYGDAYPGGEDMLPRNINGVPVVYVVNLPYLMGGRLDTVKASVQDMNPSIVVGVRP